MDSCIFCKIVKKEIPSYTVYEDPQTLGFLDINQSAPGHTMIILKRHGNSLLDYSQEELGVLMERVKNMAAQLKQAIQCDWISIGINHLEPTGVPHLHVHLIPRFNTDGGHAIQGVVKNPSGETLEAIAEKIQNSS